MRIACPGCNADYHVDESRIPASGLNMKCPRCTSVFTARRDEGAVPLPGGVRTSAPPRPGSAGPAVPLPGAGADGWEFDPDAPEPGVPAPISDPFAKVGGAPAGAHLVAPPPGAAGGAVPLPPGVGGAPAAAMPPPPPIPRGGAVPLPAGGAPPPPPPVPHAGGAVPLPPGVGGAPAGDPPPPPIAREGAVPLPDGTPPPSAPGSWPLPAGFDVPAAGEDGLPPLLDAADPSGLQRPPPAPFGDDGTVAMSRPPEPAAPDLGFDFGAVEFGAQPPPPAPELPPEYRTVAGAPLPPAGGDALEFDPAAAEKDDALLDFLDGPSLGPAPPAAPHFDVRRASGEIAGSYDRQALLRMLAAGELRGDESVSSDGVTWVPIYEVEGFAAAASRAQAARETAPPRLGGAAAPPVANAPATPRERAAELTARLRRAFSGPRGVAAGVALVLLGAGVAIEAATPWGFFFRNSLLAASSGGAAADLPAARIDLRREEPAAMQAALAVAEQALAAAPEDVEARALFAQAAFQLQRLHGVTAHVAQAQSYLDALVAEGENGPAVRKARAAAALAGNEAARVARLLGDAGGDPEARLLLADAHLAQQKWDEALAVLEPVVAAAPKSAPALHRQGLALAGKGDAAGAAAKLDAAIAAAPRYAPAAVARARLAAEAGDLDAAEKHLEAALGGEGAPRLGGPALADAWALRGDVFAALGRTDAAASAYEKAIAARDGHEGARLGLARLQLEAEKAEAAIATLEPLAKKAPQDLALGETLVRARVGAGQVDEAAALAEALETAHPEAARTALVLGLVADARGDAAGAHAAFRTAIERDPADAAAHVALARSLLAAGMRREAEAALARALEQAGGDASVQVAAGEIRLDAGDVDAALVAFDAALAVDPRSRPARRGKARALEARGDDEGAVAAWRALVEADGADWASRLGLGEALLRQKKVEEAAQVLEAARGLAPASVEVLAALALARFEAGDAKAAIELVEEAIGHDRDRAASWHQLSRFQLAAGDPIAAVRSARRAISLDGGKADYHYQLGLAFHEAKVPLDALAALQEATRIDPAHADAWERQGDVLVLLNAGADAVRAYQTALEKDPARTRLLLTIADSQLQSNRWDAAIATLQRARRSGVAEGVAFRLGIAHQEKGRHAEAIRWFSEAAREAPDDARPWKQLGYAYKATRRIRDAIDAFRRYLDRSPQAADRAEIEDEIATLRL